MSHQANGDSFAMNIILLGGGIRTRSLRQDPNLLKVLLKLMRHIFTTRVRAKFFNTCFKLSFNICQKFLKHRKHFRLRSNKIYLSKTTVIINKCNKIFIAIMESYKRHSPHITLNHLKTIGCTMNT